MTAFTQGTGTSADPFVITTGEQCAEFFNRMEEAIFAKLAADVDLLLWPHKVGLYQRAVLDGNCYSIKNYASNLASGSGNGLFPGGNSYLEKPPGEIKKVSFIDIDISYVAYFNRSSGNAVLSNCLFSFKNRITSKTIEAQGDIADAETQSFVSNCVLIPGYNCVINDHPVNAFLKSSCYIWLVSQNQSTLAYAKKVTIYSVFSETYTSLDKSIWTVDENNCPLLVNPSQLSYEFAGQTLIDGAAKSRVVMLLHYDQGEMLLKNKLTVSDNVGNFAIKTTDNSPKLVIAYDHPGYELIINKSYVLGDLIRPETPNGFRYRCSTPGNSGSVKPAPNWPTSSSIFVGTAVFTPEHLAESVSYGPITPVVVSTVKPYTLALNQAYPLGDYVKPITPVGYRWKCTQNGVTGAIYPPEPWSTSAVMQVGTAQFTPEAIPN